MNDGLLLILAFGLVVIVFIFIIFLIILIQTALVLKRLLIKLEIHVDTFGKDREEIKLKVLTYLENLLLSIKRIFSSVEGGEKNAKKEKG